MTKQYTNLREKFKLYLSNRFKNYSVYEDNETTNDLVLNFHESRYFDVMENQIHVKPTTVRVSMDILSDIKEMPNFINGIAITRIGDYIESNLKNNPSMHVVVPTNCYQS